MDLATCSATKEAPTRSDCARSKPPARRATVGGTATALEGIARDHFGIETIREIPSVVYRAGFSRDQISLLAPKVVEAAQAGDIHAVQILKRAGEELALTASGVVRQLYEPGEAADVYLTGGVFNAGPLVLEPFDAALKREWPEAVARMPKLPPVAGALILAAQAVGVETDEVWLAIVADSLAQATGQGHEWTR